MKHHIFWAAAALAGTLAMAAHARAAVVFSDNFNDNDVSDWTFFTDYDFSANPGSGAAAAASGAGGVMETYIDLPNSTPNQGSRVAQASHGLTLATAGDYILTLDAHSAACSGCTMSYDVILDGVLLERRAAYPAFESRSYTLAGLSAGAHTLTLGHHTDGLSSGRFTASFDNVVLSQAGVPEPTTWALMILGLGGVGQLLRRGRRGLAAA